MQFFQLVDRFVACTKKNFVKSPSRVKLFRLTAPNTPLPPAPVLTRWGSWLDAALYYAQHIEIVKEVVNLLDSNEAASIQTVQDILSGTELEENLVFISAYFSFFANRHKVPGSCRISQRNHLPFSKKQYAI